MAQRSFRDRFFSPPVARAVTSPSGILALGAGAALGIIATVGTGGLIVPAAAVVGGLLGYGTRVAVAIPRRDRGSDIDPFAVGEPWRHAVQDAIQARRRFGDALKTFRPGPMRDALATISSRMDEAVEECWRVAQRGQVVQDARRSINDREVDWELKQARFSVGAGEPNAAQASTIAALENQLATAARLDALISGTRDQLGLLNARLDESVTRAIELSISNEGSGAEALGSDVADIVDDLEALRDAIEDVDDAEDGIASAAPGRSAAAPPPSVEAPAPPPPPPPAPEPTPQTWPPSPTPPPLPGPGDPGHPPGVAGS
jgi:hypothetical protein